MGAAVTETTTAPPPADEAADQASTELVLVEQIKSALARVESGKATMGDLFAAVLTDDEDTAVKVVAVPAPTSISEKHRVMLTRLPEVFGKVNPTEVRELTDDEIAAIADERNVIDGLASLLKERKEDGIREIIALHFDKVAERTGLVKDDTATDDKGHYLLKQEQVVGDQKFSRQLSTKKPSLDGESLLAAYERGDITREEYLSCTREVRVYDETKTRAAFKKNPLLLVKLRKAMRKGSVGASIYLR